GKEFWIKWFIASDNEYYEKEAWNFLCRKHEVMRAAWIARNLKPSQLESYQNRKPFLRNVEIEENLDGLIEIINELEMINDPEKQGSEKLAEQKNNEKTLIEAIRKMLP